MDPRGKENAIWRRAVFERDRFICQACKDWKHRLEAHHLLSHSMYPEARLDIENGVTLCQWCHREFHKEYGGQPTPVQFDEFRDKCIPFYDRGRW